MASVNFFAFQRMLGKLLHLLGSFSNFRLKLGLQQLLPLSLGISVKLLSCLPNLSSGFTSAGDLNAQVTGMRNNQWYDKVRKQVQGCFYHRLTDQH